MIQKHQKFFLFKKESLLKNQQIISKNFVICLNDFMLKY